MKISVSAGNLIQSGTIQTMRKYKCSLALTLFWSKDEILGVAYMYVKQVTSRDLHLNKDKNALPHGQPNQDKQANMY